MYSVGNTLLPSFLSMPVTSPIEGDGSKSSGQVIAIAIAPSRGCAALVSKVIIANSFGSSNTRKTETLVTRSWPIASVA